MAAAVVMAAEVAGIKAAEAVMVAATRTEAVAVTVADRVSSKSVSFFPIGPVSFSGDRAVFFAGRDLGVPRLSEPARRVTKVDPTIALRWE